MSLYSKIIDIQKLNAAWDKAKKNKPAAGVDNVTYEMFDEKRKENICQLNIELKDGVYEPLPVRIVTLYKGEKARDIALYSMRDKVVQQSIASELTRIYDSTFSDSAYAYRPNKSALSAIECIEDEILNKHMEWVLKADIHHFFDEINIDTLRRKMSYKIKEADVLELIINACTTAYITEDGELVAKRKGIHQGSAISPLLSNLYLADFDNDIKKYEVFYVRYSDDILVLGKSRQQMEEILNYMYLNMEKLSLSLNDKKTVIKEISSGFQFLGYEFNQNGKAISQKAEDSLIERLETMWITNRTLTITEKLKKGSEILDGWEQYFRGERKVASIYEYVVVMYMLQTKSDVNLSELVMQRTNLENLNKEICEWLIKYWVNKGKTDNAIYEAEDYYRIAQLNKEVIISEKYANELINLYLNLLIEEKKDIYEDIMQLYSDLGCYNKASLIMDLITEYQSKHENRKKPIIEVSFDENGIQDMIRLNKNQMDRYFENFVGREDTYCLEELDQGKRRKCTQAMEPLTDDVVQNHIKGSITAGTYLVRQNNTAKYMVIDIDVSKKILISIGNGNEQLQPYLQKAANLTNEIIDILKKMGIKGFIEESGFRGYHIWILFTGWISVRYIHLFQEIIEERMPGLDDTLTVEFFPNRGHNKNGKAGQSIKLPLGYHIKTGKRSNFLTEDFEIVSDQGNYIQYMAKYSLNAIKNVISTYSTYKDNSAIEKTVDDDISCFTEASENVILVLNQCNLMRYLCQKARTTGYLSHFERLSLLYVFGHMGDEGATFLHQVMSFTLNYQYHVTQRFISKVPAKPISCIKLRDQYRNITAEYGCNCNFKRIKDCYPSPVLHALKKGTDNAEKITIPTSKTLSKEKESKVCSELNINQKVQDVTGKILEFKKQKRAIDKNIVKLEKELEKIFDEANIDCMEVEFGMLTRRKKDGGYEWIVEI